MPSRFRRIGAVLAVVCTGAVGAVGSTGCSSIQTADLGYAQSLATGRQQLMARARAASGDEHLLFDAEARARVGPDAQQAGVGLGVLWQPFRMGTAIIPHLGGGGVLLELGRVDEAFEIGAGEPWAELGVTWMVENERGLSSCEFRIWAMPHGTIRPERRQVTQKGWGLTLTGGAQYDVRFTGQPNELIWAVTLGASEVTRYGPCLEQ